LEQTAVGLEETPADLRKRCLDELQRLRKAGRLTAGRVSPSDLARQSASFDRFSEPAARSRAAHRIIAQVADGLAAEAPNLAALLRRPATSHGTPLLAAAFAFFFRRELEDNQQLANGLTFDSLRQLSA